MDILISDYQFKLRVAIVSKGVFFDLPVPQLGNFDFARFAAVLLREGGEDREVK